MKLTKSQFQRIIKEELNTILNEQLEAPETWAAKIASKLTHKWKWCKPKTATGMAPPGFSDPVGSWLSGDEPWEHEGPQRMDIKYGLEWFRNFDAAGQEQIYDEYLTARLRPGALLVPESCGCYPELERKGKRYEACDTFNDWLWNYKVPPEYKQEPGGDPLGADPPTHGERSGLAAQPPWRRKKCKSHRDCGSGFCKRGQCFQATETPGAGLGSTLVKQTKKAGQDILTTVGLDETQLTQQAIKEELDAFFQEDSVYSRDDFTTECKTSCCADTENCTTGEEACVESCVAARIKAAKSAKKGP